MSKLNIDSKELEHKLDLISKYENIEKIEKKILKKGLSVIRTEARKQLRKALPAATKRNPMYDDTLSAGIMQSVITEGDEVVGKVHIMGTRRSTSGTYRLRFFEGGTVDRVKKSNSKSTGHIKPLNFFETARNMKESEALRVIDDEWDNEIEILLR